VPGLDIECRCRKPLPGMVDDAVRDLQVDPSRSWVVGDKWLDVNLGHAVGARTILVRTGWGAEQEQQRPEGQRVDAICDNLIHAVSVIIGSDQNA
jgi:histidinol phosphatase-like enzyme